MNSGIMRFSAGYENDWIGLIDGIDALVVFEKQIWNVRITLQKIIIKSITFIMLLFDEII